jgi:hypothetical protein
LTIKGSSGIVYLLLVYIIYGYVASILSKSLRARRNGSVRGFGSTLVYTMARSNLVFAPHEFVFRNL